MSVCYVICGKPESEVVVDHLKLSPKIQVISELQKTTIVVDGTGKSLSAFEKWMDRLRISYTIEKA